jgi:hypothetical protein
VAGGGERTTLRYVAKYADASNLGATSRAGSAFGSNEAQRKLAVLRRQCKDLGRACDSILRTCLVGLLLTKRPEELPSKIDRVPQWYLSFMQQMLLMGTSEDAAAWLRARVEIGFRYFFVIVAPCGTRSDGAGFDYESLGLWVERVIPATAAG